MKKRNGIFGLVAALAAGGLLMAACEDFFHEIFEKQPEGDRIISFSVEGLAATVGEKRIDMALPAGAVAPQIEVSPGATLIPISEEYARETFGLEITALWNGLAGADASGSLTDHARSLVQNAPGGFKTPALDKRIDFSKTTVGYLVIAGSGATRLYEVNAATPPLPVPQIIRFDFLVADNPNLAADAVGLVNGNNIDITVTIRRDAWNGGTAAYPLAPTLGFSPADARLSDSGGREIKAGEPFHFDSGHTLLTLAGNRQTVGGELRITYEQEPAPPPPEITRFDFLAADNPGFLAADATGAISGNTISLDLTIRRDVWGAMDYLLIPSFDVSQADAKLFWGGPEIVSGEYLPRRLLPNLQTLALTLDLDGQTVPYMLTIAWLQEPAPPVTFTVNPVAYPIAGMDFLTPLAGQRVATVTAVVGGLQSAADAAGVEIAYESLVGFMANITGEAWLDGIYDPAAGTKTFALMIEYDMGEVFSPNVTLTVRPGDLPPGHGYTGGSVNIPLTIYDGRDDHTNRRAIPLGQDNWRAFHWFAYAAGSTLNYRLIEDIDYAAGDGDGPFNALGPIATRPIHPFNGTFDGGHRRIHGLDISGVPPGVGLFGLVYHGEIRNLRVQGDVSGANSVGGIVGILGNPSVGASGRPARVENCSFEGRVLGTADNVGGIVGTAGYALITGSRATGRGIGGYVSGLANVGGIVGSMTGGVEIANCYAEINVTCVGGERVGGIAGYGDGDGNRINRTYYRGTVTGYTHMGGILGRGAGTVIIGSVFHSSGIINFSGTLGAISGSALSLLGNGTGRNFKFDSITRNGYDGENRPLSDASNPSWWAGADGPGFVFHPDNGPWWWDDRDPANPLPRLIRERP